MLLRWHFHERDRDGADHHRRRAGSRFREIHDVDVVITDPVWPNCPAELLIGADRPADLLAETLSLISAKRVVIILRSDSDPRFLRGGVPDRWPFVCTQAMSYAVPMYLGACFRRNRDRLLLWNAGPFPRRPARHSDVGAESAAAR